MSAAGKGYDIDSGAIVGLICLSSFPAPSHGHCSGLENTLTFPPLQLQ